jgi:hypothetical protein
MKNTQRTKRNPVLAILVAFLGPIGIWISGLFGYDVTIIVEKEVKELGYERS